MDTLTILQNWWGAIVAVIGGVTLLWNFIHKTVEEIRTTVNGPLNQVKDDLQEIKNDNEVIKRALLSTQRKSLLDSCTEFIGRGYISVNEKETLLKQYESYSELGGNSFIHEMVDDVKELPLDKPEQQQQQ